MIIRNDQVAAMRDAALENFQTEMVEHLREFAPKHSEILGVEGIRPIVRLGWERALVYGFTNRGPARLYLELMFMLGSDFDTDPQLPWAAQILTDQASPNQMSRADRLYEKSGEYVAKVAGPDYEYAKQALRRAKQVQLQGLSLSAAAFETELLAHLRSNHPEKCHYIGEPALRSLIPLGVELAKRHSIATSAGLILLTGLAFALGHGFSTDLQFPWISSTLGNDRIGDPNKRVERLYSKTMTYLDHVLAYHER